MCRGVTGWRHPDAVQPPVDLDHIGIGTADVAPALRTLVGRLGATLLYGGHAPGCRYVVSRVGDADAGMDLELLEPHHRGEQFLPAFLARHGAGPHHLCFLVRELDELLSRVHVAGLTPALIRTDDPLWREAFLRPRDAGGIVVQLAETSGGVRSDAAFRLARDEEWRGPEATPRRAWTNETGSWWTWPGARGEHVAVLVHVAFGAHDLGAMRRLYGDLLGGEVAHESGDELELRWPRGGMLRFIHAPEAPEGVAHLVVARLPVDLDTLDGARLVAAAMNGTGP